MRKAVRPDLIVRGSENSEWPAFADVYAVAGRFISVESDDRHSADLFRNHFSNWHVESVDKAAVAIAHARVRVMATANPPKPPINLQPFGISEGGLCHTDNQNYFLQSNGSAINAGPDSPARVEVWIRNTTAHEPAAMARLVFHAAMTAMRRCGLFELHAAGVVAPDDKGLLIIGPSGSAKSTLATQLAAVGWRYLSDDTLLLSSKDEIVQAHALRRVFAIVENSYGSSIISKFDGLTTALVPYDPLKRRFEPETIFPKKFVKNCAPRQLFFSRITNQPHSHVYRISQAETMARLIRMCPWAAYDKPVAPTHLRVLAQLARQATGYRLLAGTDLMEDAEYTSKYLRREAVI